MSTIRDVARAAEVSPATVSRVLNGNTRYKMKKLTVDRVRAAARDLNYTLNDARPSERKTVACVLCVTPNKYQDPYFLSILDGAERYLRGAGYEMGAVRTYMELEDEAALTAFVKNISGLLLMDRLSDETFNYIRSHVPHIVGIDTLYKDFDSVGFDHFDVAFEAVEHLAEKGHKKIAFIGGSGDSGDIHDSLRYKGYVAAMLKARLEVTDDLVADCQWDESLCMEQIRRMATGSSPPTAVLAASDLMAMAALTTLYEAGVAVPQQIAVMGISNIELSKYSNPPLTTWNVPTREIGEAAAEQLVKRLDGDTSLPKRIILPVNLVSRSSV